MTKGQRRPASGPRTVDLRRVRPDPRGPPPRRYLPKAPSGPSWFVVYLAIGPIGFCLIVLASVPTTRRASWSPTARPLTAPPLRRATGCREGGPDHGAGAGKAGRTIEARPGPQLPPAPGEPLLGGPQSEPESDDKVVVAAGASLIGVASPGALMAKPKCFSSRRRSRAPWRPFRTMRHPSLERDLQCTDHVSLWHGRLMRAGRCYCHAARDGDGMNSTLQPCSEQVHHRPADAC